MKKQSETKLKVVAARPPHYLTTTELEKGKARPLRFVDGDGIFLFGNHYIATEITRDPESGEVITFKCTRCARKECHDLR